MPVVCSATGAELVARLGALRQAQGLEQAERVETAAPSVCRSGGYAECAPRLRKGAVAPRVQPSRDFEMVDRHGFAPCFAAPAAMQLPLRACRSALPRGRSRLRGG